MANCYSGSNPIGKLTDAERLGMWKWVKENAVDHGMPMEQVHEAFNNHFAGGTLKAEWVNEFLAARKTPFKRVSDEAWAAQARRRAIQQEAKHLVNDKNASVLERGFKTVLSVPRRATLGTVPGVQYAHAQVFPFSHAGALILNPTKWLAFARLVRNTWRNISPAEAENLRDTMTRAPRFTLARRSQLDLSTHGAETGGGNVSARTWGALTEARFRLWDAAMDKHTNASMSAEDIDSIGKELAVWANHATGSGEGLISDPRVSWAVFGPKLTQSYWNRIIGDPIKTFDTWTHWSNATAGEKVVATQRLKGSITMAATYTGMLMANQAFLAATGQKDQTNWNKPSQADWLAFKWGGMQWGLPGALHSEIKLIGKIITNQMMTPEDLKKAGMMVPKNVDQSKLAALRQDYLKREMVSYGLAKATPAIKWEEELRTGHDFMSRPEPWSPDKGDPKHPKISWGEFAWSKAPIPLSAAAGFVYDQLRNAGASVHDASMWIRAAIVAGASATMGTEPKAIKDSTPHRTRYQSQVGH